MIRYMFRGAAIMRNNFGDFEHKHDFRENGVKNWE